jgi:hypothetical protein
MLAPVEVNAHHTQPATGSNSRQISRLCGAKGVAEKKDLKIAEMAKGSKVKSTIHVAEEITRKIYIVRGQKVMLDFDLAVLYEVETKRLNEQVKRNTDRFPADFMFRLTAKEWNLMRSQNATGVLQFTDAQHVITDRSQNATIVIPKRNTSVTPFAFTEHGVTMLASVLKSERAIKMSIAVVRAFIELTKAARHIEELADQLEKVRGHLGQHDAQLDNIYKAIEDLLSDKATRESWNNRKRIGFKNDG